MTPVLILLTISRIQLGDSFSVSPQAKQLVTRGGLYSRIRNPIYVFGTIVFAGPFLFLERSSLSRRHARTESPFIFCLGTQW
jgi:protein-S-isoprenylcysteine O-methyltransferase Ste14